MNYFTNGAPYTPHNATSRSHIVTVGMRVCGVVCVSMCVSVCGVLCVRQCVCMWCSVLCVRQCVCMWCVFQCVVWMCVCVVCVCGGVCASVCVWCVCVFMYVCVSVCECVCVSDCYRWIDTWCFTPSQPRWINIREKQNVFWVYHNLSKILITTNRLNVLSTHSTVEDWRLKLFVCFIA